VRAIWTGHLRLLADLAAPDGTAILITDVASPVLFPVLGSLAGSALPGLLPRLARDLMAMRDVAVSSGLACTSSNQEPRHVFLAMGLDEASASQPTFTTWQVHHAR
jgi:hypothetical protein